MPSSTQRQKMTGCTLHSNSVDCSWNQDFVSGLLRTNVLTQNSRDVTKNSKGLETIKLPTQFWENPQTKQENRPELFNVKFKHKYYFSYVNLYYRCPKTRLSKEYIFSTWEKKTKAIVIYQIFPKIGYLNPVWTLTIAILVCFLIEFPLVSFCFIYINAKK